MTIAEKIIAIAKNMPKIYKAGRKSIINESKIMKKTVSEQFLHFDDVSELSHDIEITLSSDTSTEFSAVKITGCGKNLVDVATLFPNFKNEHNGISYTNTNAFAIHKNHIKIHTKATVTISAGYEITTANPDEEYVLTIATFDETGAFVGNSSRIRVSGYGEGKINFTCSNVAAASFSYDTSSVSASIVLKNIQIEVGELPTEYEQYNGETVTADASGVINGIKSLSPYMNIFSDTKGINLVATYYKSGIATEVKESFFNSFQKGKIRESISFEWLYLSKASITGIINALSGVVAGQTLTLSLSVVNTAFQTASGAADGGSSDEWKSLLATKPNWTINLV